MALSGPEQRVFQDGHRILCDGLCCDVWIRGTASELWVYGMAWSGNDYHGNCQFLVEMMQLLLQIRTMLLKKVLTV